MAEVEKIEVSKYGFDLLNKQKNYREFQLDAIYHISIGEFENAQKVLDKLKEYSWKRNG